uniref:Arylsulfotransferase n=1 Tax=Gongylonema pulchrum TaxID=637853 RepID=A0A183EMJ8_9BILA
LVIILAESLRNEPTHFRYFYRDQIGGTDFGPIHSLFTTIDMGRGLLHFVYQSRNQSMYTMDPSGNFAFYTVPGKTGQDVYQQKVDYPAFTLSNGSEAPKQQQPTTIFTVNGFDQIFPLDRDAVLVWKFATQRRSAWLYEGSYSGGGQSSSFYPIGCISSGISDPSGELSLKIHQIRRQP